MRWDAGRGFHVPGLVVKECATVDDMLNVRSRDTCPDALWFLTCQRLCGQHAQCAQPWCLPREHLLSQCQRYCERAMLWPSPPRLHMLR